MYKSKKVFRGFRSSGHVRPMDTFSQNGYELNVNGFIRNDFSQLNETNDINQFARALSNMQEFAEEDSNKGKTFEQIISELRPRWCQLPGELDRFEQYCIDNALDFYKRLKSDEDSKRIAEAESGAVATSEPAHVE